jgi:hypothetical protein
MLRQLPINFVGYVEGRELSSGGVDVVVCDGFVGNLVLKSIEGFGQLVGDRLRAMFEHGLRSRLAYLLLRRHVASLRRELDPRETGGALLLGLNGIVVKAHGSSDGHAIRNALAVAAGLAGSGVTDQVALGLAATVGLEPSPGDAVQTPRARRFWNALRDRLRRDRATDSVDGVEPVTLAPSATPIDPPVAAPAASRPETLGAAAPPPTDRSPALGSAGERDGAEPAPSDADPPHGPAEPDHDKAPR